MADSDLEFYWRPGCVFCSHLEKKLIKADIQFTKINIWEDDSAAAYVRSVADGNETVPTIKIGDTTLINPSIKEVQEVINN